MVLGTFFGPVIINEVILVLYAFPMITQKINHGKKIRLNQNFVNKLELWSTNKKNTS